MYRKSHCGDKMILRQSYLHNGISYTGKMTSSYWIRPLLLKSMAIESGPQCWNRWLTHWSYCSLALSQQNILGEQVNTTADDVLVPCISSSSAAMLLTMEDEQVLIFYKEGFQPTAPSQCWEMVQNANIFLCFLKINSARQRLINFWSGKTCKIYIYS